MDTTLEARYKTVVVRPLTSHFADYQSKKNKTCWAQLENR